MESPPKLSNKAAEAIATRWQVTPRTVRRWVARGLNLDEPLEIIDAIVAAKTATIPQLNAALREVVAVSDAEFKQLSTRPQS